MSAQFELVDLVDGVREQLERLAEKSSAQIVRFNVESIELELNVVVKKEAQVGAKAKFWVLELGEASGKISRESTNRVKLTLKLAEPDGLPTGAELSEIALGRSVQAPPKATARTQIRRPRPEVKPDT